MNRYKREGIAKIRIVPLPHANHNYGDTHTMLMNAAASLRRLGQRDAHKVAIQMAQAARLDGWRAVIGSN